MNSYIQWIESFRFSLIDEIQISLLQNILLVIFIAGMSYWLMEQKKSGLTTALFALTCFSLSGAYEIIQANKQEKIIIYNVPQKKAVDFIEGRKYFFVGDSSLLEDDFARNFHLKPSRILNRTTASDAIQDVFQNTSYISYHTKHIILLDKTIAFLPAEQKPVIDLLILSKNPRIYIKKLAASLTIRQVVVDGTVPAWKAKYWEKDCASLGIPYHHVTTNGAFVMNL
jgi:competence protein ComEC